MASARVRPNKREAFAANQFSPTSFSSAEDKAWFANRLLAFIESDFPKSMFSERLYQKLSCTFGHHANYDRDGFYSTFFTCTEDKVRFVRDILENQSVGGKDHTYSDAERCIAAYVRDAGTLESLEKRLRDETEAEERSLLAKLKAKYEVSMAG